MTDTKTALQFAQRVAYFVISIGLLTLVLKPEWEVHVGGLLIGIAASLINSWHLHWKTVKITEFVARLRQKPRITLGFLTRASIGVLAFVIAERVLHYNFYMTIAGLYFVHLVAIAFIGKSQNTVERGDKETWNT